MEANFRYLLVLAILLTGCQKDILISSLNQTAKTTNSAVQGIDSINYLSLKQVEQWYSLNVPTSKSANSKDTANIGLSKLSIDWQQAQSFQNKKGNYWLISVPGQSTFQNYKQGYRKVAFMKDSVGHIYSRILEIIPDGIYFQRNRTATTANFTGLIFIYNSSYKLLAGRVYAGGKIIGQIKARKIDSTAPAVVTVPGTALGARTLKVAIDIDCEWIDANYFDGDGLPVIYSEQVCLNSIYDDGSGEFDGGDGDFASSGGGGGSDPGTTPAVAAPTVSNLPGEGNPAVNPALYMNCFGNIAAAGATMSVTVYVQEPWPGTSFNIGPNSVGHTAIGLTKSNGGSTITQTLGFYPNATGYSKVDAPSKIVDNSNLSYNVSITYNVDAVQFANLINYISNPPATYDLSSFNCTDFVIGACGYAGISLPSATNITGLNGATMSFQYSNTPAGLGSSIEDMQGQPGVNTNGGFIPQSNGPCN